MVNCGCAVVGGNKIGVGVNISLSLWRIGAWEIMK